MDRRAEHWFFSGMALLMLATVFIGFARTYFLAGMFTAKLPSVYIHVHGAAFSLWILLLVTQTSLVNAGRTDIHRKLGLAGFLLACLMVALGVLAATDSLVRSRGPAGRDALSFYLVPLTDMVIFATLVYIAWRMRRDPASHKRLIYVATAALLIAAIARWPVAVSFRNPAVAGLFSYVFLVILAAYDLWSLHRVHQATLYASSFMIAVQQLRLPIGMTSGWHAFAGWVQTHAQWLR